MMLIGLSSIDVLDLNLFKQKLNNRDLMTIDRILEYSNDNNDIKELNFMKDNNCKVEIEALYQFGYNYLSEFYIPKKILK
jgi:DNA topoisomerase VI subunit A